MSQELERVYTINLGKVLLSANNRRAKRAINMIREFARHHMKIEDVRIDEDLAHQIWKRGIKHPPRKVKVRMTKTEDGYVLIALYEEELETKVTPEEKAKDKVKPKDESKEVAAKVEEKVKKEVTEKPKKTPAKEKPKKAQAKEKSKLAGFVDPKKGAQHYIDRYNKEKKFKDWFHKNYPRYSSIYEAVGLEEPKEKPKKAPAKEEKLKKKSS